MSQNKISSNILFVCGLASLASLASLAFASEAFAATNRYYPGGACQPYTSSASPIYSSASGFYNGTSTSQLVLCPASFDNGLGTGFLNAAIYFTESSSTSSISCRKFIRTTTNTLYSPYRYSCGTAGGCSANSQPGYTGNSSIILTGGSSTDPFAIGIGIECNIPSGTYIRAYRAYVEN